MNSDWLTEIACEARERYANLVMPYECKKIPVPKDVLRQALAYLSIADEADEQWKGLIGLSKFSDAEPEIYKRDSSSS